MAGIALKFEFLGLRRMLDDATTDRRGAKIPLPEPRDLPSTKDMDAATTRHVATATAAAGGDGRALMVGLGTSS